VGSPQTESQLSSFRPSGFVARRPFVGGHLQTLAGFFLPRRILLPEPEERLIEVAEGVKVLCHCHWQAERQNAVTIIIVHGLEGSSESGYVVGITQKALTLGMNVVRMNQRNCGGTDELAPTLYNSSLSSDVAAVARDILQRDRIERFVLAGFSMGGNLVLKTAGEWGAQAPKEFKAVAAVCPAMDLAVSADALHLPANRIYEGYFMVKLRSRFRAKTKLFPGHFDAARLEGVRSLRQFDDRITAFYCGFNGAVDYYARASATNTVEQIAVPGLILHAASDPFVKLTPETRVKIARNPNLIFVETPDGGHCSFIAPANGYDGRWAEQQVVEFFRRVA
jgi:predicted alpha/beta-fold hydrolase